MQMFMRPDLPPGPDLEAGPDPEAGPASPHHHDNFKIYRFIHNPDYYQDGPVLYGSGDVLGVFCISCMIFS